MTGIFLIFVAIVWMVIALLLALFLASKISKKMGGRWNAIWIFLLLLPLPVIDEIVGKRQFEQLCKDNSTIQLDRATAVGKTVYLAKSPDIEIKGTWVRIVLKPWRFVDVTTNEPVVTYNTLQAEGGRFIQALGISEGGVPLTFKGSCAPKEIPASVQTFKSFGINYIEPPVKK